MKNQKSTYLKRSWPFYQNIQYHFTRIQLMISQKLAFYQLEKGLLLITIATTFGIILHFNTERFSIKDSCYTYPFLAAVVISPYFFFMIPLGKGIMNSNFTQESSCSCYHLSVIWCDYIRFSFCLFIFIIFFYCNTKNTT